MPRTAGCSSLSWFVFGFNQLQLIHFKWLRFGFGQFQVWVSSSCDVSSIWSCLSPLAFRRPLVAAQLEVHLRGGELHFEDQDPHGEHQQVALGHDVRGLGGGWLRETLGRPRVQLPALVDSGPAAKPRGFLQSGGGEGGEEEIVGAANPSADWAQQATA